MVQIEITKQPLYGSVEWNGYEFVYTPREGYTGNDIYYYKKTQNGVSQILKNYVNPTNTPPITRNVILLVDAFSATTININDIVTDESDPFDALKIIDVTPIVNGSVTTDGNNIYYTPNTYNTVETFIYTVTDKQFTETGTITLSVINGNEFKLPEPDTFKYIFYKAYNNSIGFQQLSGNWVSSHEVLTANQNTWNNFDVSKYISFSNVVEKISSSLNDLNSKKEKHDSIYLLVSANSGLWVDDISIINVPKYGNAKWDNTYNILTSISTTWNDNITAYSSVSSDYYTKIGKYNSFDKTVTDHISSWNSRGLEILLDDLWEISTPIVQSNSGRWNTTYTSATAFSSTFEKGSKLFNISYDTLTANLSVWSDRRAETIMLSAPKWIGVASRKDDYDNLYTYLTAKSGSWIKDNSLVDPLTYSLSTISGGIVSTYEFITTGDKINTWNTLSGVSSLSSEYDYNTMFSIVTSVTADRLVIDQIMLSSSKWDAVYSRKDDYDNLYTYLTAKSGSWIKDTSLSSIISSADNYNTIYNITTGDKIDYWNTLSGVSSLSSEYDYNTMFSIVTSVTADRVKIDQIMLSSSKWDAVYSRKDDYDNLYTYLTAKSGSWIKDTSLSSIISSADNYNTIYNITTGDKINTWNTLSGVSSLSSEYDYNTMFSIVTTTTSQRIEIDQIMLSSSKWDAVYSRKDDYDNLYTYLSVQSGLWIKDTSLSSIISSADNYNTIYNITTGDKIKTWNIIGDTIDVLTKYNYNTIYNIINTNSSAKYEMALSSLNLSGGSWDLVYNNISSLSDVYQTADVLNGALTDSVTSKFYNFYKLMTAYNDTWTNNVCALSVVILSAQKWNTVGDYVPSYFLLYNTVCSHSGTLITATTGISSLSGSIISKLNQWNLMLPILYSINVNGLIDFTYVLSSAIDVNKWKFDSVYNTLEYNKKYWPGSDFYNILSSNSTNPEYRTWIRTNDLVINKGKASYWNGIVTEYDSTSLLISGLSSQNNKLYSYVPANTGGWQYNKIITSTVSTNSAKWLDSYNTTTSNSGLWTFYDTTTSYMYMDTYNFLAVASGNLANSYTLLTGKSALWLSGNSFLSGLSTQYLTGNTTMGFSAKDLTVKNLTIKGNLTTYGARTIINNSVQVLDQFQIDNNGNNNAVDINKDGTNAVIQFNNSSSTVLYVKSTPKVVGINLSGASLIDPTITLTVSGDISASGYTDPYPSYITAFSGLSTRYETIYSYLTGTSGKIATYQDGISAYDNLVTYVPYISAFNTVTIPYYNNYNKSVSSYSTKLSSVCGFVTSYSGDWEKDFEYRKRNIGYDNTYTFITANSSLYYSKYNIGHLFFSSRSKLSAKKVDLMIQDNIKILSWNMTSDVNTIATIDVLSTDYINYERNGYPVSIVNGNYLSLNSTRKNTGGNINTLWIGDYIPKGSILRFAITNNTAASSLLINLVVQKQ